MKNKTLGLLALAAVSSTCWLGYVAHPKQLPPDGTETHTWQVTWLTSSNTVLVTEHPSAGQVVQQFWSDTAMPRRNWGDENIRYHWFGKPTFALPPDTEGNRCTGKMVK